MPRYVILHHVLPPEAARTSHWDFMLEWDAASIESALRAFAEGAGWSDKDAFMAVRVAATGRVATPPLFETLAVLGKEVVRRRLRRAIEALRAARSSPASEVISKG